MCAVRMLPGMWYTVQQPGYFSLLPTSGRQCPRGGEMIIKKKVSLRKTYFQLLNKKKLSSTNRCEFESL
jgi:hypothetical protein